MEKSRNQEIKQKSESTSYIKTQKDTWSHKKYTKHVNFQKRRETGKFVSGIETMEALDQTQLLEDKQESIVQRADFAEGDLCLEVRIYKTTKHHWTHRIAKLIGNIHAKLAPNKLNLAKTLQSTLKCNENCLQKSGDFWCYMCGLVSVLGIPVRFHPLQKNAVFSHCLTFITSSHFISVSPLCPP